MAGDGTEGRTGGGGSILQKLAATDESDGLIEKVDAFEQEQGDDAAPGATYDDIRATIAASRARFSALSSPSSLLFIPAPKA